MTVPTPGQSCPCQACGDPIELVHRRTATGQIVDDTPLWLHRATRLHHCAGGITDTAVAAPTAAAVRSAPSEKDST